MELINWSLSALDTIFSRKRESPGEPNCPSGTQAAGYVRDAWDSWLPLCLDGLQLEDVEDIYIFWTLILGLVLIGLGTALVYRKTCNPAGGKFFLLMADLKRLLGDVSTRLTENNQQLARIERLIYTISARSEEDKGRLGEIGRQNAAQARSIGGMTVRLDEVSRILHTPRAEDEP